LPSRAPLIHLQDTTTSITYLVNSGAAISLVPHRSLLPPTGPAIVNANGGLIPSWSFVSKFLHFGSNKFHHQFLQANVSQLILGADFFQKTNAKIDFQTGRVIFPPSSSSPHSFPSSPALTSSVSSPLPYPLTLLTCSILSLQLPHLPPPHGLSPLIPSFTLFTPRARHCLLAPAG
jgi:hypothetical protein